MTGVQTCALPISIDAIRTTEGKDIIIEMNDSMIGLAPEYEQEDMGHIRDIVLEKLK